ncbi:MAG TPA: SpoIIE family protein phosphatase [Anaerolineae bacterium]
MSQLVEVAWDSLCKHGEELCGDWVKISTTPDTLIVTLSDGLGSGVKANILATLTAEIATKMLVGGCSIDEVVETLAVTLPECQVRRLAYATFAVLSVRHGREAYLVEYDSPPLILVRGGQVVDLPLRAREIGGRTIREGSFVLENDDYLVMLSDGYLHAGVGGLYAMGWGWKNIATAVRRWAAAGGDSQELTAALRSTCLKLSGNAPGDDATAIGMHVRQSRRATVLTGPPADPVHDRDAVARLMSAPGSKIICGGTTAQMAARVLGKELKVEWQPRDPRGARAAAKKLPPAALLEGADLVTEGILTLSAAVDLIRNASSPHALDGAQDVATRLARLLLAGDQIHFIVGDAINPGQLADVVRGKPMRQIYVEELVAELLRRNKQVTVEHL